MKRFYEWISSMGSRIMLLLGESIVTLERHTKKGLYVYWIMGTTFFVGSGLLLYLTFSWEDIQLETPAVTQELETPPVPLPPRYLFLNDYYFFESELDLESGSDLILIPENSTKFDKEKLKADFLERELFVKDKQMIDNELSRLVR